MASLNKAMLIGNLGKDPVNKNVGSTNVCEFSIATTEKWKDKAGQKQEKTEWHNIKAWGKTGEICAQYLKKGSSVYVEGRIGQETWEKDGVKHYKTVITVDKMVMLGSKDGNAAPRDSAPSEAAPPIDDDSIPF